MRSNDDDDKSIVVRHSSQFIIYECVDMELFLVFIMATLLRAAGGGGEGLRRTWGLGFALSRWLFWSMSANFQITCEQQRTALSVPERLANICLISEMTDLTVQTSQGTPPLCSLSISLSLSLPHGQYCRRMQTVRLTKDILLRRGFVLKPWKQPPMREGSGRGAGGGVAICVCWVCCLPGAYIN